MSGFTEEQDGACQEMTVLMGDCQLHGTCKCGTYLGYIKPDGSLDRLADVWERHAMLGTPGERLPTMGEPLPRVPDPYPKSYYTAARDRQENIRLGNGQGTMVCTPDTPRSDVVECRDRAQEKVDRDPAATLFWLKMYQAALDLMDKEKL